MSEQENDPRQDVPTSERVTDVGGPERSPLGRSAGPPTFAPAAGAPEPPAEPGGSPEARDEPRERAPEAPGPAERPEPIGPEGTDGPLDTPSDWHPVPVDAVFEEPVRQGFDEEGLDLAPPRLAGRPRGRRLVKAKGTSRISPLSPKQRLLILDTWRRSGLPAGDFAAMVGISKHTLYKWNKQFERQGPAGLLDAPKGKRGSRLPDLTRRSVLMLKEDHPDWGCQRISDMLMRGPGLGASPSAVARVLKEEGYEFEERVTQPHRPKVRRFERAKPNQLWQTDLFTFVLKRQNRRVYLVAFLDDNSRFLVGYGLHASQSSALVLEVVRAALTAYGTPLEILTDNGSQYITWRGTSAFSKELRGRGIKQIVASPRHPQTLGKIERFWGTLWRECVKSAVFIDLADARKRIGHFVDYYNFHRSHRGIEGLVPADRYFDLAPQVRKTLQDRVSANALELARNGLPKAPFYLTGQAGGKTFSVHAEGERVILSQDGGDRQEVDLVPPSGPPTDMPDPVGPQGVVDSAASEDRELPPGVCALDEGIRQLRESLEGGAA